MNKIEKTIINDLNILGLDMSNFIGSNIPEILYSLYAEELNYKRNKTNWFNRDRVIFSCANKTSLLYAALYLSGFEISLDDLENYGKTGSNLPLTPVYKTVKGIDTTISRGNEGIGFAVGTALAENYYESLLLDLIPKNQLINYYTFCICDVNDLLDGLSYEALAWAGMQKLNKLIIICDKSSKDECIIDDFESILDILNINVLNIKNNIDKICEAIENCKKSKKPSIIFVESIKELKTEIKKEEKIDIKIQMKHSLDLFKVNEEIKERFQQNIEIRTNKNYKKWLNEYEKARSLNNKEVNAIFDLLENDVLNIPFDDANFKVSDNYFESLITSNNKILNYIADKSNFVIGGTNNKSQIIIKKSLYLNNKNHAKNIKFINQKNAIGNILNGLASSNIRTFGSFKLSESKFILSSIKASAFMDLPICYIFQTDQTNGFSKTISMPIEEVSNLRLIPGLTVIRPCDINEIIGSWEFILKNRCPVALILNDTKMPKIKNTNAKYLKYGAYMIRKENFRLDGIIIASGEDVLLATTIAEELFKDGIDLRVVSMPSMELLFKQNPRYEEQLLPKTIKTFTIENGRTLIWNRFASDKNCIFGNDSFDQNESSIDKETIKRKIKENI